VKGHSTSFFALSQRLLSIDKPNLLELISKMISCNITVGDRMYRVTQKNATLEIEFALNDWHFLGHSVFGDARF